MNLNATEAVRTFSQYINDVKKKKKTRIVVGCHTAKENLEIVGKLQYANKKRKLVTQARWWRPGIISK